MSFSQIELNALNIAKEITIAKLSQSSPTATSAKTGESIGSMFVEIYKAIMAIQPSTQQ